MIRGRSENDVRTSTAVSGPVGEQPPRRLDAVQARHVEVHEHDVGLGVARALDGLLAVGGEADELHVGQRLDEPSEAVADDAVVVGDEDADHRGRHLQFDGRPLAGLRNGRQRAAATGATRLCEQRQPDVALLAAALALVAASKPLPSSVDDEPRDPRIGAA